MIRRLMTAAALFLAMLLPGAAARAASWGADYFPNVPLVTQDGKTVRFYDDLMKNKLVLINFIFTSCDQVCPLDTAKMAQVQKLFGDRIGRDIFMYSITLDPENDTPQALKAYAEKFGAKPGWLFLTGKREDIDQVRARLGAAGAKETHANAVRIGNVAAGQWMRVPLTADSNYIGIEINNTFNPGWSAGMKLKSIAEAPAPEVFGPGQILFHNRCAACHTVGKGDHLGPDLKGLTARRDRAWVTRYLAAPEKMRAAKDPIALDLSQRYKVLMPNLGLTGKEMDDVLAYLEAKTADGVPPPAPAQAKPDEGHDHAHHHHHHADAAH